MATTLKVLQATTGQVDEIKDTAKFNAIFSNVNNLTYGEMKALTYGQLAEYKHIQIRQKAQAKINNSMDIVTELQSELKINTDFVPGDVTYEMLELMSFEELENFTYNNLSGTNKAKITDKVVI